MSGSTRTLELVNHGIAQGADKPSGPRALANASWPRFPRRVPTRPRIPVTVRLVWSDKEEWVHGHATRWSGRHVFVAVWHDRVRPVHGVWVDAADVRRSARAGVEKVSISAKPRT